MAWPMNGLACNINIVARAIGVTKLLPKTTAQMSPRQARARFKARWGDSDFDNDAS